MTPPACPRHVELVARATGDHATDEDLARYAEEVPECPECRRTLAVALHAHPTVLAQGGTRSLQDGWRAADPRRDGWRELHAAVTRPRRPWLRVAATVVAAAAVGGVLWGLTHPDPVLAPTPGAPPTAAVTSPPTATASAPPPPPVGTLHEPALERLVEVQRIAPEPEPELPPLAAPPPPDADPPSDDAVAMVDDWEPPPFEDLRGSTAKSAPAAGLRLVLSGEAPRRVHDAVSLAVVAEGAAVVSVCVTGPEQGVVWRGAVPAGRTELARAGRLQSFAFAEPGSYRFSVAPSAERCDEPVQHIDVEVVP